MTLPELTRALGQLRLGGMAALLETRLQQAQAERLAPLDWLSILVSDELTRRADRLLERRRKQARFRDAGKTLDTFDFDFNRTLDRALLFELATARFIAKHQDVLFLGPPGTGKSHLAQALGHAAIHQASTSSRWRAPMAPTPARSLAWRAPTCSSSTTSPSPRSTSSARTSSKSSKTAPAPAPPSSPAS
jgi:DNA replication protein DnaC